MNVMNERNQQTLITAVLIVSFAVIGAFLCMNGFTNLGGATLIISLFAFVFGEWVR